jgi:ATP-dependent RNA helicase DeaD
MTNTDLFSDLPAPIAAALARRGFTELTAVQRAVVEAEHSGRDLRVSSQTGSGKTVAIGLALAAHFLERPIEPQARRSGDLAAHPRALVIVPTRELAAQVREELKWLFAELPGATVEVVTGGTSILRERIALSRRPAFVVGTPGRLLDHMRNDALACDAIEHVILDEADQMLDMGFKDELDEILLQLPEKRASHLVSATFPRAVKALADRFQKDPLTLEGTRLGLANPDIEHIAYSIRRHETYAALVNVLLLAGDSRCLLFVNRRIDATELAEKLAADGFGAAPFSGELPQAQRTRTLAAFRNGLLPILVSTDVAARGIDVPEISTVIHVDPPRNPDAYVHRSGRTGRAGLTGRSILLVVGTESKRVGRMLGAARVPVAWQPVPRPAQVEQALEQRAREQLEAQIDAVAPSERQRMAAKQMLAERDPVEVVAGLLELAKPKPPRAPMAVEGLDPYLDEGRGKRGRNPRDARDGRSPRDFGGEVAERRERGPRPAPGDFDSFVVSWGEKTGASTPRVLSHVCRRGGLSSEQIGAIRVFAKNSIIEIARDAAEAFAARVREPDERDPGITIERARPREAGPASAAPPARPAFPARSERPPRAEHVAGPEPERSAHFARPERGERPSRPSRPAAGRPHAPQFAPVRRATGDETSPTIERYRAKKPWKAERAPGDPGAPRGPHGPRAQRDAEGSGASRESRERRAPGGSPHPARKPNPKHAHKSGGRPPFGPRGEAKPSAGPSAGSDARGKPGRKFAPKGASGPPRKDGRKGRPGGPASRPRR